MPRRGREEGGGVAGALCDNSRGGTVQDLLTLVIIFPELLMIVTVSVSCILSTPVREPVARSPGLRK